jgi:hypothetical protein
MFFTRMIFTHLSCLLVAAAMAVAPVFVHAQATQSAPAASGQPGFPPAPGEREANGVRYLTGGVGVTEADKLRVVRDDFSLQLTFTGTGGKFLAGVDTRLMGADGKTVFSTVSDGPFLFVHMPPGQYRVVASYQGQAREDTVTVPAQGGVSRTLTWQTR